ncbi:hypothetical protein BGZ90_005080 [Linnemannia elongata]|nr:hypothetical protein BGZ90_005080 [Linnemannia elongata]
MLLNALEEVAGNPTLTDMRYSPTMRQEYHRLRNLLPSSAFDWSILPEHHLSARPWARLREFEVYGDIRSGRVMLVLPLMPSLTRLKIRTIDGFFDDHIQIERIMRDCKHLESLHISRIDGREQLPGPWVPLVPSSTVKKGFSFSSVSLKSLVLERVSFKQVALETFLEHGPSLKELRIFGAAIQGKYVLFDTVGLAGLLRRLSLPLESFHISTANRTRDSDLLLYHNSQRRTLWSNEFTIYDLRKNQVHNNLTTLELVPKYGFVEYDNPQLALHNYLCSSPHLLHLKAPETCYPIAHMDLHGRHTKLLARPEVRRQGKAYPKMVSFPPGSGSVRTSRLSTSGSSLPTDETRWRRSPFRKLPESHSGTSPASVPIYATSPWVMVHIVQTQPKVAKRFSPHSTLGGFCLLGRLKHLERIEIGRFTERAVLLPQNFEWMHESGRTEDKKAERRALLENTWKSLRLMSHIRKSVAAAADVYANTGPGVQFDWTAVDPVLMEELRYLGWPVEVQAIFDELDKPAVKNGGGGSGSARGDGGVECFRALSYSCICAPSEFDLPPEQDYKRFVVLPGSVPQAVTDPKVVAGSLLQQYAGTLKRKRVQGDKPKKRVINAFSPTGLIGDVGSQGTYLDHGGEDEAKESEDSIDPEDSNESCNDSHDDRETFMSAFGLGHPRNTQSWCRRKRYPDVAVTAEKYSTYIKESLAPRSRRDRNNSHLVRAMNVMHLIKDVARVKKATARRQAFEDIRTAMVYLDQRSTATKSKSEVRVTG